MSDYSDEWYTPAYIIEPLGLFDLDPCSPKQPPYQIAATRYTIDDDGLSMPWEGRVWLNPPYSNIPPWLERAAKHGNVIALLHNRMDTKWWYQYIWLAADGVVALTGRIRFLQPDGTKAGTPNVGQVLIAYGKENAVLLANLTRAGKYAGQYLPISRKHGMAPKSSKMGTSTDGGYPQDFLEFMRLVTKASPET